MIEERDIVEDIFTRIRKILGQEYQGDIAGKIDTEEQRIRQEWGGSETYVSKKRGNEQKREQALQDLKRGIPANEVSRKTGISRAQVYRLLKGKK